MSIFVRIWDLIVIAARRLLAGRWLTAATGLGLVSSVALAVCIPMYADAIYYRLLQEELRGSQVGGRPPFSYIFRYVGAWEGSLQWEDIEQIDQYFQTDGGKALGIPQYFLKRYFESDRFSLYAVDDLAYAGVEEPLFWVDFGFFDDPLEQITLIEGAYPQPAEQKSGAIVEVLISEELAEEAGIQVGEEYVAYASRDLENGTRVYQIPVRIAGIWRATDPQDAHWFYEPSFLSDTLLVNEESFKGQLSAYLEDEVNLALWYLAMDGSAVYAEHAPALLSRTIAMQQRVSALLPNISLDISPFEALRSYQESVGVLTFLLFAFAVPIFGLNLAFIGLVGGLLVSQQQNETAIMRSRGATPGQIVIIALVQGILLGIVALLIGLPAGSLIAHLIGRARSFLDFSLQSELRVGITWANIRIGIYAIGVSLLAILAPTTGAARHTIVTYKQERARMLRPPFWQRAWLDILLFIPVIYGFYLLQQQGSIAVPGSDQITASDPFQNPLLFLLPALGVFSLSLFFLRFLPLIMSFIAWLAARTHSVGLLLAARHLARSPRFYSAPVVLLVLTLSLSAFTASVARTLDQHLYDRYYYQVGAELHLAETGELPQRAPEGFGEQEGTSETEDEGPAWMFPPVSEHLRVPGVRSAARVGRYPSQTELSGAVQRGDFIGLDRVDFPQAAYWRVDFSPDSLGALMNELALYEDGVLISREYLNQHGLKVGDTMRITVHSPQAYVDLDLEIVGVFDLFPAWYPEEDGPLFVGNLDYLFEMLGWEAPYDVWLSVAPGEDLEAVVDGVRGLGLNVVSWKAAPSQIALEQERPERQGLFGVLSVGFIAAAFLTVIGFLLYAISSFRRRFIELGVLRATGLQAGQMASFLAWELAFLIFTGGAVGTLLGIWISYLFIPYLQVGADPTAMLPPFIVQIDWLAILRIYFLFGLLFVAALAGLAGLLMRMKIFQAIKLGETT